MLLSKTLQPCVNKCNLKVSSWWCLEELMAAMILSVYPRQLWLHWQLTTSKYGVNQYCNVNCLFCNKRDLTYFANEMIINANYILQ